MMYFHEMTNKWGFNDGNSVPVGIDEYRTLYITAINLMAERLGSQYRAVAYDRCGGHNWCLILFVSAEEVAAFTPEDFTSGEAYTTTDTDTADQAMRTAIEKLYDQHIDEFVEVTVEAHLDDLKQAMEDVS
jgi:hypothetical protein